MASGTTPSPRAPGAASAKPAASAAAVTLANVAVERISHGGYSVKFTGTVPPGASVFLQIGDDAAHRLDITGGYRKDQLDDLLDVIDDAATWGTTVQCKAVIVGVDGVVMAESASTDFVCPVEPYDGALTFDAIASAQPKLTYPGNGHGRVFKPRRDGRYYFENGGRLETDNAMRGFDCTTFPMAMFQTFPNMAGLYATALAVALGAEKCDMEMKKEKDIRAFFADPKCGKGLYFMWSAGHVLLVKDAWVHEFTFGGYKKTEAARRPFASAPQGLWWTRKLPDKYKP